MGGVRASQLGQSSQTLRKYYLPNVKTYLTKVEPVSVSLGVYWGVECVWGSGGEDRALKHYFRGYNAPHKDGTCEYIFDRSWDTEKLESFSLICLHSFWVLIGSQRSKAASGTE